tara:strand:+ start:431 stop:1045 length:615 start_codon:yes stop_codon:yes gene_type:complete
MSEEEPETLEPTSVEEQLNTENAKPTKLNKNGKPRKQLSPEALERLAKAREKANAIRKQQTVKKLEQKVEKLNTETQNILPQKQIEPEGVADEEVEIVKEKPKPKPKSKKKTKIIVEQSSDDSDEFEQNDNVVFVKRVSRKKKETVVEPPPVERQPQIEQPNTEPQSVRPPRPELTHQQRVLKSQYENMFNGGFMNNDLSRRHY